MSNDLTDVRGACLCGKVSFRLKGIAEAFYLCHCKRCRKATGTAHAANIFTEPGNIEWLSGEQNTRRYQVPEAKSFSRVFCTNCGSGVPYINRAGTRLIIPAGSLDTPIGFTPNCNIFWGSKVEWYEQGLLSQRYTEYLN